MTITAVVLTKNCEKNIAECLGNLRWTNEIIVIDDFSEDRTAEIAERAGAKVFRRGLKNDFAAQRNFALSKANGEWVLFIDSDEIVNSSLVKNIVRRIEENQYDGFLIPRVEYF